MEEVGGAISETFVISWRLVLMALVVVFVVLTAGATFTSKQDIRPAEAVIVSDKILDCISENGVIKSDFNIDCFKEEGYYINASLVSLDSNFKKEIIKGNSYVGVNCRVTGVEMAKYPACLDQNYYLLIDNNGKLEKGKLSLLVGVEKYAENI